MPCGCSTDLSWEWMQHFFFLYFHCSMIDHCQSTFLKQVEYKSEGFLEKNRDTVYEVLIAILRNSKVNILFYDSTIL